MRYWGAARSWMRSGRRRGLAVTVAFAFLVSAVPTAIGVVPGSTAPARADEITVSHDNMRTNWDQNEPLLTPAAVGGGSFQQMFSTSVNGQVYAQPLVVGTTVIVATENDWVYGLDSTTGAIKWSVSLGKPYAIPNCTDIIPNLGVTSGPVYDPSSNTVYMVAQTVPNGSPTWHLFGVNASTGAITEHVSIGGHPTNDSSLTFNPSSQLQRGSLLLMNGTVYASFGSHCDHGTWNGWITSVNVATKAMKLWTDESGVTEDKAGIWMGGSGLMSDGPGRIIVASGNGVSPAPGKGTSPPGQLAESVIRLAVGSSGNLSAKDFFSPANAPTLDAGDTDLGSGGPVGLPFGTGTYPHVLAQAGKDGRIFLLNRDNLGGRKQGPGGTDAALSVTKPVGGEWGHPSVFGDTNPLSASKAGTANNFLYFVGKKDYMREFKFGVNGSDKPTLATVAHSSIVFGYTSGSPAVTSNGTDPSSALVWVVGAAGVGGSAGSLNAFRAVSPASCTASQQCTLKPVWSAPIGTVVNFAVPATDSGHVYVGTRDGKVFGFGIVGAPLAGARPLAFGNTSVNSTATTTVGLTATRHVTVSGVTATTTAAIDGTNQFSVGKVTETAKGSSTATPVSFPVTLSKGDKLNAPVTFAPTAAGGAAGSLSFATQKSAAGRGSTTGAPRKPAKGSPVTVPLSGNAVKTGLSPTSSTLSFALFQDGAAPSNIPVGTQVPTTVDVTNDGTTTQTVTSVVPPSGAFTATGLPTRGTQLKPGQTVSVQVTFAPTQAGAASSSLSIAGSSGTAATIALSGTALAPVSKFTASQTTVNFGSIPRGKTGSATVTITNAGNVPATVSGTATSTAPFASTAKVAKNLPVNPSYDLKIPVTFTPGATGTFTGSYQLTWKDLFGTHTLTVHLKGTGT
ncbi:MAG TPA: choice-of-anchor D domain-containing protein [Streptosporangiaceae bacterium]|nr:choice-of-anchor D domain-containing protein [Streptosporangiaceae bacterium]